MVPDDDERGGSKGHFRPRATHVVEQRVSNLAQGLLPLGTMTGPLLLVLHLIPQGVLAGLFFVMGVQALAANGITAKLEYLFMETALTPAAHPLRQVDRPGAVWAFVGIEILGFGATFAITQTVAAVGFPIFILLLIPIRALLLPRLFAPQELAILDAPTASPFTMESVGGSYGGGGGGSEVIDAVTGSSGEEADERKVVMLSSANEDNRGSVMVARDGVEQRRKSDEHLAELGENSNAILPSLSGSGPARRRPSASGRGPRNDGPVLEMQRIGTNRRGHSGRSGH